MSKKLLISIVIILIITNITSLFLWGKGHRVAIDSHHEKLSPGDIVAEINGEDITYLEWINVLIHDYGKSSLQSLINHEVVRQLADQYDVEVNEKVIKKDIYLLTSMQGIMTEEEFNRLEEDLREDVIYRYQLEQILTKDISIPENEIQAYYNTYKGQYNFTETMQISHILVKDYETANKIKHELDQGASFSKLAKEYSIDVETKNDGGYIGFIHTNSQFFPSGYEEVARPMEEHTYSEPFQAENGIAIMYLHRNLPSITFTYDEIRSYLESELALKQLNMDLSANELWDQLDIEWIYDR